MKRQIYNSIKKAFSSATEISKLREGMIRTGAGHIEMAHSVKLDLEKATTMLISLLEEVRILKPELDTECNTRVDKAEKELDDYEARVTECISETVSKFENTGTILVIIHGFEPQP